LPFRSSAARLHGRAAFLFLNRIRKRIAALAGVRPSRPLQCACHGPLKNVRGLNEVSCCARGDGRTPANDFTILISPKTKGAILVGLRLLFVSLKTYFAP